MFPLSQLHLRYKNVARGGEYELQKAGKQCGVGPFTHLISAQFVVGSG